MDSSPDLSLKLRRGSNDSRDSYYMDFAQGIDSDIEEVATIASTSGQIAAGATAGVSGTVPTSGTTDVCSFPAESSGTEDDIPPSAISAQPPSSLTISSDNNNSTTDEDISPTTPLPMPLLPPLPIQMLPKKSLVDDE